MELPILYEDADIVAVNKPAGLITHSDGRTKEETAEDWFKERCKVQGLSLTENTGYVHRLDRDTSGVLIFAKTVEAYEFMRKAFHDREVQKTYLALVYGAIKEKSGVIDFDIGRSRKDFRLRSAQPKAKGRLRDAVTRYEVVGEYENCSLLKVMPETGRTHQIRVHLKAIHHPIVGDKLYGPKHPPALLGLHSLGGEGGITRLALHAHTLEVPLPSGGRTVITATIPDDLAKAFAHFPSL